MVAAAAVVLAAAVAAGCTAASGGVQASPTDTTATAVAAPPGDKLDHLIFIVQENRSFDHYFGTYPGADGIPTKPDGSFAVCVPDPGKAGQCVPPYVGHKINFDGGPHDDPRRSRTSTAARWTGSSARSTRGRTSAGSTGRSPTATGSSGRRANPMS
jgi:hypothetical protein